uniref:Uncharacterized protein n=1 Tax=Micrococcus phage Kurnik TaxID=3092208 RepID=A0AAU6R6T9_9CAUD
MAASLKVESVRREITVTLSPEEAKLVKAWLRDAHAMTTGRVEMAPLPHIMDEFYGAVSAISESREYGGH